MFLLFLLLTFGKCSVIDPMYYYTVSFDYSPYSESSQISFLPTPYYSKNYTLPSMIKIRFSTTLSIAESFNCFSLKSAWFELYNQFFLLLDLAGKQPFLTEYHVNIYFPPSLYEKLVYDNPNEDINLTEDDEHYIQSRGLVLEAFNIIFPTVTHKLAYPIFDYC